MNNDIEIKLQKLLNKRIEERAKNLDLLEKTVYLNHKLQSLNSDIEKKTVIGVVTQFNSLITISEIEISAILKGLCYSSDKWEKVFYLKTASINIYETLETFKKYNQDLVNLSNKNNETKQLLKDISVLIKNFRKRYEIDNKIKNIRNKTIGHIDKNMKVYYDLLQGLDFNESIDMILSYNEITDRMLDLSIKLLDD